MLVIFAILLKVKTKSTKRDVGSSEDMTLCWGGG